MCYLGGIMKTKIFKLHDKLLITGLVLSVTFPISIFAAGGSNSTPTSLATTNTVSDFNSVPMNLTGNSATPLVMINASKDHQLFFKAYSDTTDLDPENNDGVETTYKPGFRYYGYFDSSKCYDYSTSDKRFEPTTTPTDDSGYCTTPNTYWSGNFLNWVSMARIDIIRKVLFGGHRRVDTATTTGGETVLERTYLPHDAHSWAKYYDGNGRNDINKLTPFTTASYTDADKKKNGITFCNTTDSTSGDYSQTITDPPLIKVVKGNYALWAGNERWQCTWDSGSPIPTNETHSGVSNSNDSTKSGIYAYPGTPTWSERLGNGNYVARIHACVQDLLGDEKCKLYPGKDGVFGTTDDVYKPIGLLQVYGDEDQMYFGMISGTYKKHTSGGSVVKEISSIRDEIDVDYGGTFLQVADWVGGAKAQSQAGGIINAWSLYRIIGYNSSDGTYGDTGAGDNCSWGLYQLADVAAANRCMNWGNPFSEIYAQSLNYLSGGSAIGTYQSNDSNLIEGLNTPQTFDGKKLLDNSNYCARLSVINFNSSIASYDADELDGTGNSYGPGSIWSADDLKETQPLPPAAAIPYSQAMTDWLGTSSKEGINGNSYFFGYMKAGDDYLCTSKNVTSWGQVLGICPESPHLQGSYRIAGLAYYAHTKSIRSDLKGDQTVDTYSVAMGTVAQAIEIPDPYTGATVATILPACQNTGIPAGAVVQQGSCAIVDFKIVSQVKNVTSTPGIGTGKFYVNWEDSEQGGDYDQDMWGIIEYTVNANVSPKTIAITTQVMAQSTIYRMGFGYVISGTTTNDGFHAHSGILGYKYTDTASGSDCTDSDGCKCRTDGLYLPCTAADGASTKTYNLSSSGVTTSMLKDPLWYASKWGGFTDDGSHTINNHSDWDKVNNLTGESGPDQIPDNYFYAKNPAQLEDALNRVFLAILQRPSSGTAAAVVSNNVSGVGALYQAYYEPLHQDTSGNQVSWTGTVQALWLDSYGYLREENGTKTSDGGVKLDNYLTDPVIELFYDESLNKTRARRFVSTKSDTFAPYYMKGTVTEATTGTTGTVTFTVKEISDDHTGSGPFQDWIVYNLSTGKTWNSSTSVTLDTTTGGTKTFNVSPAPPTNWFTANQKIMVAHFESATVELTDINPLWNASKQLSSLTNITTQRNYTDKADDSSTGGRFIKTWLDGNKTTTKYNGRVDTSTTPSEYVNFTEGSINDTNLGFFNLAIKNDLANLNIVKNLVNYIRGQEISGFRPRTLDVKDKTTGLTNTKVMRLGDIINSTPTVVGAPQENFDLLYRDSSYTKFKNQYAKRRQVVYAGANDGMLHAFNGGFYDSTTQAFNLTNGTSSVTAHPLGAELWAYVPMNLLPHLKWLKDPNYKNTTHVYYVDGKPKVFDAKIFDKDAEHPGSDLATDTKGWGTVMVVGMRFGGGDYYSNKTTLPLIDTAADGGTTGKTVDNLALRSAYIIMDITDPEAEPKLLAEIPMPYIVNTTNSSMYSFSTSYPAAFTVKQQNPDATHLDYNKWFLTFGSGPMNTRDGLTFAKSTQSAKFYVLDLEEIIPGHANITSTHIPTAITGGASCSRPTSGTEFNLLSCDTNMAASFVGDPIAVDWELNYKADSLYFGLIGAPGTSGNDQVMRLKINESYDPANWIVPKTFIKNPGKPVVAGVTPGIDEYGQKWIFFGTGRFYVSDDKDITKTQAKSAQSIYGVKEANAGSEVEVQTTDLQDVSSALVATDGSLSGIAGLTTVNGLKAYIKTSKKGWALQLPVIQGTTGSVPATRVLNQSALAGGVLFTTAYQPGIDTCSGEGLSRLYGLYYETGTAYPDPTIFGSETIGSVESAKAFIELGYGYASTPSIHTGSGTGNDAVSVFTQLSTGAIIRTEANTVLGVRSGMTSWKEKD